MQKGLPNAGGVNVAIPVGGWTIQRSGAVLLEGTERFSFDRNVVTRCDGNGLFLSNYNRNTSITGNEFSWIGDNAMSAFGSMGSCLYANCSVRLPYASGLDGRPGNQPRHTRVTGNLVHEVGMMQKQSGAWAQHLTAATHLESNVFLNGPHSAIDFNDGFGGGDEVVGNVLANWNRQTWAHGVVNVWERSPYIYDQGLVRDFAKAPANTTSAMPTLRQLEAGYTPGFVAAARGVGSVVSPFRRVHNNLFMARARAVTITILMEGGWGVVVLISLAHLRWKAGGGGFLRDLVSSSTRGEGPQKGVHRSADAQTGSNRPPLMSC